MHAEAVRRHVGMHLRRYCVFGAMHVPAPRMRTSGGVWGEKTPATKRTRIGGVECTLSKFNTFAAPLCWARALPCKMQAPSQTAQCAVSMRSMFAWHGRYCGVKNISKVCNPYLVPKQRAHMWQVERSERAWSCRRYSKDANDQRSNTEYDEDKKLVRDERFRKKERLSSTNDFQVVMRKVSSTSIMQEFPLSCAQYPDASMCTTIREDRQGVSSQQFGFSGVGTHQKHLVPVSESS